MYRSGQVVWHYVFSLPGSTRQNRQRITGSGFATKGEALDAEVARRIQEQQKQKLRLTAGSVDQIPKTLAMLLEEFFRQHVDEKLAPKTVERYHEQSAYLDPTLLNLSIKEITPLHLGREWQRLLHSGGHHRQTRAPRPLSAKTVRNVAGVLSSAFARAVKWGLLSRNPVPDSEPPVPKKHHGMALAPPQQRLLLDSAAGPWWLPMLLEMAAATGARRGEVLALRWSDIQDGRATIARSLTQTNTLLEFKCTKSDNPHVVGLPTSTLATLEEHRRRQDRFRQQFGPDYRAALDLIFANPDGTPLKPDSVSATVSVLCRRLKLPPGVSLHTLRHTHGSHLLANGVPLPVVSARLGHSSVRVTADIYSHAIHGQDDEAARKWEEFQGRNAEPKAIGGVQ